MKEFNNIQTKLTLFYKKYYRNKLIKGGIFFLLLGLLYLIFTIFIEYFLWLKPTYRTFLFWLFIFVECFLLYKFILSPIIQLFRIRKGINDFESSKIIGDYFPQVQDKLLNLLQLKKEEVQSDLLVASIEQKSKEISPIPFTKAINFKENTVYLKYLIIPFLILVFSLLSDMHIGLFNSVDRFLNHQTVYAPPAPFVFSLETNNLKVIQGSSYRINVTTIGDVVPEEVRILYNSQEYLLQEKQKGIFHFTFTNVIEPIHFFLKSGNVVSNSYLLNVLKPPIIENLVVDINYPNYTKKKDQKNLNIKNFTVPEGTLITWKATTNQVLSLDFIKKNQRTPFKKNSEDRYYFKQPIKKTFQYHISSSNKELQDYEKLSYTINVFKDESPQISIESNSDSLKVLQLEFLGQISDDYGISALDIFYYKKGTPDQKKKISLNATTETLQTFYYQFPNQLELTKGVPYEVYFQVSDNDAVNGSKKTVSNTFFYRQQTEEEIVQETLKNQRNTIQQLENTIQQHEQQYEQLKKIQNEVEHKKEANWSDKKKVQDFIKRQQQYEQIMERQTEKLQESLEKNTEETLASSEKKKELKKRIEELKNYERKKRLLKELQKIAEKFNKENLIKKVKQLSEENKQQERSLERVLELTKRFYIEEKTMQIARKLQKLSKEQDSIVTKEKPDMPSQNNISAQFKKITKELEELNKDNSNLKEPLEIPSLDNEIEDVEKALSNTQEKLSKKNISEAKKSQQQASDKMNHMSKKMQQAISNMQENSITENIEDLRKILENLITFSFTQEDLLEKFNSLSVKHPAFGKSLKKQNDLKSYFEHIDDSLFVLSMRLPKLSVNIQKELSDTYYNLDRSLENFSENNFIAGSSNQQYVLTSVNNLSDFLSNLLNNMRGSLGSGKGTSTGQSFSLPTIIEKQKGLSKKLKNGLKKRKGKNKSNKQNQGDGNQGKGQSNLEEEELLNGQILKIYQEQSFLRSQLKDLVNGNSSKAGQVKEVLKTMEQLENEILEKGFSIDVAQKMQELEYELLKLDTAKLSQGKESNRNSKTNKLKYSTKNQTFLIPQKPRYNQQEILNRQLLPLQDGFKKKVQDYFLKKKQD